MRTLEINIRVRQIKRKKIEVRDSIVRPDRRVSSTKGKEKKKKFKFSLVRMCIQVRANVDQYVHKKMFFFLFFFQLRKIKTPVLFMNFVKFILNFFPSAIFFHLRNYLIDCVTGVTKASSLTQLCVPQLQRESKQTTTKAFATTKVTLSLLLLSQKNIKKSIASIYYIDFRRR